MVVERRVTIYSAGVRPGAGSYIVEFDVPAYLSLYPSFLVFILNLGLKAQGLSISS